MALKYTEEQLNSLDRETLTKLFLSQQEQLENIDHNLQLVLEQMADLKDTALAGLLRNTRPKTSSPLWKWMGRLYSLTNLKLSLKRETHRRRQKVFPAQNRRKKAGETGRRSGGASGSCGGAFHDG